MMLLIIGLAVMGLLLFNVRTADEKELTIGELNDLVTRQTGVESYLPTGSPKTQIVQTLTIIGGTQVRGEFIPEVKKYRTFHVAYTGPKEATSLTESVKQAWRDALKPQNVKEEPENTGLQTLLVGLLPWILIAAVFWFVLARSAKSSGGPGGVLNFGRSRARVYMKERVATSFEDVAGVEEAKAEVREIVDFLKSPGKFTKIGARIPRGVLLVGPPGCGKTLLAKAIAGEAAVPFFSISGSDFVEMFVGVGASRVRDLFKQARESAPCIIFLDEIDAVGRRRGTGLGGGHDEREQTLNQILVEMDGFDTDQGIIMIAATNRPDVLDPALLRPGRFDRQVVIDLPDLTGREAILRVHARKVKLSPAVDLATVARATPGFSGADLEAIVNEAALMAALEGDDLVEPRHFEESRDKIRFGRARKSRVMSEEDRRVTAYHEAGHALMTELTEGVDPLHKVTIIPRGMALGLTMFFPEKDQYGMGRKKLLGRLRVAFGGRVAEELVIGDITTGAQNDIEQATETARLMVTKWGMSDKVGPVSYAENEEHLFLGREVTKTVNHSEATAVVIDGEVKRMLDEAHEETRRTLLAHMDGLHRVARALLEFETLSAEEMRLILAGGDLAAARATTKDRDDRAKKAAAATAKPADAGARPAAGPGAAPQGGFAY
jgi:cell division protease FtsH